MDLLSSHTRGQLGQKGYSQDGPASLPGHRAGDSNLGPPAACTRPTLGERETSRVWGLPPAGGREPRKLPAFFPPGLPGPPRREEGEGGAGQSKAAAQGPPARAVAGAAAEQTVHHRWQEPTERGVRSIRHEPSHVPWLRATSAQRKGHTF